MSKQIQLDEIDEYPAVGAYSAHNKEFKIVRYLYSSNIKKDVNLSYRIYVRKRFLNISYWSSLTHGDSTLTADSMKEAKEIIDKIYPFLKVVEGPSYSCY